MARVKRANSGPSSNVGGRFSVEQLRQAAAILQISVAELSERLESQVPTSNPDTIVHGVHDRHRLAEQGRTEGPRQSEDPAFDGLLPRGLLGLDSFNLLETVDGNLTSPLPLASLEQQRPIQESLSGYGDEGEGMHLKSADWTS
jgi:hypothetical protein